MDVSPDGRQLVVIGNFKNANGVQHDQIVKIDLTGAAAAVIRAGTLCSTPRPATELITTVTSVT